MRPCLILVALTGCAADVTPDVFLGRIGQGCEGLVDKFPGGLQEILESGGQKLKKMGVTVKQVRAVSSNCFGVSLLAPDCLGLLNV